MKKFIVIILAVAILLCCTACGEKNVTEVTGGNSSAETGNSILASDKEESNATTQEYEGVEIVCGAYNKDFVNQRFNITMPTDRGRNIRYGTGSSALDGTCVLLSFSLKDVDVTCTSVENIYEAYKSCWEESIEDMRHDRNYFDFSFSVENREMKEINGFSMCRYVGTHTYKLKQSATGEVTDYSCYCVAYGTQLSNGAYIYWIVFDNSADQSLKDRVIANADNMAESLKETELL